MLGNQSKQTEAISNNHQKKWKGNKWRKISSRLSFRVNDELIKEDSRTKEKS